MKWLAPLEPLRRVSASLMGPCGGDGRQPTTAPPPRPTIAPPLATPHPSLSLCTKVW